MSRAAEDLCLEIQLDPRQEVWTEAQQAHARACPRCRSFMASVAVMRERLRSLPSARLNLPPDLRQSMLDSLGGTAAPIAAAGLAAPGRSRSPWTKFSGSPAFLVPLAMAASLTLGVILEKQVDFGKPGLPDQVAEVPASLGTYIHDVTHDHYLLEKIGRPLEISLAEAAPLSTWLSESLSFDFSLPAESAPLALEGGRVWHTLSRLSALASYRSPDGSRVVLFAVPAENLENSGAASELMGQTRVFQGNGWGHEARVWIHGDLAYALTAPEGHLPAGWEKIFLP